MGGEERRPDGRSADMGTKAAMRERPWQQRASTPAQKRPHAGRATVMAAAASTERPMKKRPPAAMPLGCCYARSNAMEDTKTRGVPSTGSVKRSSRATRASGRAKSS